MSIVNHICVILLCGISQATKVRKVLGQFNRTAVSEEVEANASMVETQALCTSHIIMQVGTNGIFSFSEPFYSPIPRRFPSTSSSVARAYLVAPYWDDIDIRIAGNISYEVHSRNGDDLGSNQLLKTISNFVEESTSQSFNATWLLVAEWKEVHPWPHGLGDPFLLLFFPNSNMVSL